LTKPHIGDYKTKYLDHEWGEECFLARRLSGTPFEVHYGEYFIGQEGRTQNRPPHCG
jgi:hypothetical protein